MITRIEALNYRCLRHVAQDLGPFHILVGPNASGKSTFLDVPGLMRDIVRDGRQDIGDVISSRAPNYEDLVWKLGGQRFEVAVEVAIPESRRDQLAGGKTTCRYELGIGKISQEGELGIHREYLEIMPPPTPEEREETLQQDSLGLVEVRPASEPSRRLMVIVREHDVIGTETRFEIETSPGKEFIFNLSPRTCALANLPPDDKLFPVANWFRQFLVDGVKTLALDPAAMRRPSPPTARRSFLPDGSSLPWILGEFLPKNPNGLAEQWLEHVRIALPTLRSVRVVERPEDKHKYLKLSYEDGLEIPSWLASDGTLRFLALTLLAYLPDFTGTYLIEEPENGIHPTAVELVYESLRSVYDGQVLVATHSPAVLSLAELNQVLCFDKTDEEGVRIIPGHQHPRLRHWKGEVSLGTLFAGGVLG
jgi:hypothetical protein